MSKVSILMNCYNGERHLREAIDSVIAQTYTDWELIFWDNQSSDGSADIVRSYDDERIKYIYSPRHTPLGEARNLALVECAGKYVAFLDTDDVFTPNKLELQTSIMENMPNYALCYGDYEKIDYNSKSLLIFKTKHESGFIFDKLLSWYDMGMMTVMIRSHVLKDIKKPYFDEALSFSPDFDLFLRIAAKHNAVVLKEVIAKYRVSQNSLTQKTRPRHSKEIVYTLIKLEGLYPELYKKYEKEFEHCYKWAAMMRANYLISIGEIKKARGSLKEASYLGGKHFRKYLLSYLPKFIALPIYKKYFEIG